MLGYCTDLAKFLGLWLKKVVNHTAITITILDKQSICCALVQLVQVVINGKILQLTNYQLRKHIKEEQKV